VGHLGDPLRRRWPPAVAFFSAGAVLGWTVLAGLDWQRSSSPAPPTVLPANTGLLSAPAARAGALFPGVMPLMVDTRGRHPERVICTPEEHMDLRAHRGNSEPWLSARAVVMAPHERTL
jgi:hypothetical protein